MNPPSYNFFLPKIWPLKKKEKRFYLVLKLGIRENGNRENELAYEDRATGGYRFSVYCLSI